MASSLIYAAFAGGGLLVGAAAGSVIGLTGDPLGSGSDLPPTHEEEHVDDGEVRAPEEREKPVLSIPDEEPGEEPVEEPVDEGGEEGEAPEEHEVPPDGSGTNALVVTIDGIYVAHDEFIGVSGIVSESEPDPETGGLSFHPLVLERVFRGDDELYSWHERVSDGDTTRRNVTITLVDGADNPLRSILLEQASPTGWERTAADEGSGEPARELITFASEGVYERMP
jgi:hypothetical protein